VCNVQSLRTVRQPQGHAVPSPFPGIGYEGLLHLLKALARLGTPSPPLASPIVGVKLPRSVCARNGAIDPNPPCRERYSITSSPARPSNVSGKVRSSSTFVACWTDGPAGLGIPQAPRVNSPRPASMPIGANRAELSYGSLLKASSA
jgi:hypothetical protein